MFLRTFKAQDCSRRLQTSEDVSRFVRNEQAPSFATHAWAFLTMSAGQALLSTLRRALREQRHFSLAKEVLCATKARVVIPQVSKLGPTQASSDSNWDHDC
jgi:hypothetical protein